MKLKVKQVELNVRVDKPSVNASCYQWLAPGTIIEVDGHLYDGDDIDGNNKWYRDEANNYYWSGGVDKNLDKNYVVEKNQSVTSNNTTTGKKFNFSIQAKKVITKLPAGTGKDITIAILDSGIDTRFPSLKSRITKQKNYQSDTGRYSHATQVAGFLVANNTKLLGLCPDSNLYDLRIANNNGNVSSSGVVKALEDIYDWNDQPNNDFCDIINMSLDINYQYPKLQSIVDDLVEQGVIILVAGTDGKSLNSLAKLDGVIPVGAFKKYRFEHHKKEGLYPELQISFLNRGIKTTSEFPLYKSFRDSSAYTAFSSGLVAKFLSTSSIPKKSRQSQVVKFLKNISTSIKSETTPELLKPYTS